MNTDQRIRRYVFRPEDIVSTTFIANIALDEGSSCEDTFAYFSDELGYGLIAYSWQQNKSWRFSHGFFMPDPLVGDFNIAGLNFQWSSEGIFGITTSPIGPDGYRTLYFSPLTSNTEFAVSTRILRDERKVTGSYRDFYVVGPRGANTHTTAKVMDTTGVQLFSLIDQNAIGCWNSALPHRPQNIALADKDDVGLIFSSDVKIDEIRNVWVMSDRMPVFLESDLDYSDINFRIYTAPLKQLLAGTVCEPTAPVVKINPTINDNLLAQPPFYGSSVGLLSNANQIYLPSVGTSAAPPTFPAFGIIPENNNIPRTSSYINFSNQPSVPFVPGDPIRTGTSNRWPIRARYQVSENVQ